MASLHRDQDTKFLRELTSYYERLRSSQRQVLANDAEAGRTLRRAAGGTLLPELEAKLLARHAVLEARRARVAEWDEPASAWQCPKRRFGRTELQLSVVTCGGMRQQLSWKKDAVADVAEVPAEVHDNFKAIMRRAVRLGINHFETAWGYGTSELQYGDTIRELEAEGLVRREDILLQTKVGPKATAAEFRKLLEQSFEHLGVDYVDLFAFHGINRDHHLDWVFNNGDESNWAVAEEYRAAGKIRHIGFSTHAITPLIVRAIETDKFDYVNLHYQWMGSYTATGTGTGAGCDSGFAAAGGNHEAVRAAKARDMGVFVISPYDKGGMLYKPSEKVYDLCMPEMSPMEFEALWSWLHPDVDAQMHTISVGAARPSDFDEPLLAAARLSEPGIAEKVREIDLRLRETAVAALGAGWFESWHRHVPHVYETKTGIYTHALLWTWSLIQAFGMYDFAMARANGWHNNGVTWDPSASYEENMETQNWHFVPGCNFREDAVEQLLEELREREHPNPELIIDVLREVHNWTTPEANTALTLEEKVARGWGAATDQPWVPYPER